MKTVRCFLILLSLGASVFAADNAVTNGGFESGLDGWRVWSRTPGAITSALDADAAHGGEVGLRLDHCGAEDWSLEPALRMSVQPGASCSAWRR